MTLKQDGIRLLVVTAFTASLAAISGCEKSANSGTAAVDYNWNIRPILSENCFRCHGPDAKSRKAGLRLDLPDAAKGELPESPGKFAIVPGKPNKSELMRRVTSTDGDVVMPPRETHLSLSAQQIALLERWIDDGAEYKGHWAFIAPTRPAVPRSDFDARAVNPIDHFIFSRLQAEGLGPSPEADKETLVQRVALTLTGLPATREEVAEFLADQRPEAYERLVDRMLAKPAYGERMATEWLDAARFADSDGYLDDDFQRTLYPWRDWVIKAFNSNMPYDEFGKWQIAGDLYENATKEQKLATMFGRLHRRTGENGIIDEEYRNEYVLDRADTVGTAMLGLSVGCARCHDHKFDPISQVDYYSLAAFFNSIDDAGFYPQMKWATGPIMYLSDDAMDGRITALKERISALESDYSAAIEVARTSAGARAAQLQAGGTSRVRASLRESVASAETAHFPFDTYAADAARVKKIGYNPSLAPSEPLFFSPSATPGLQAAVLQSPILKKGVSGNALFFDDNNTGYIDRADKVGWFDRYDEFSVDLWVYPRDVYEDAAVINHNDHLRYGSGGWSVDLQKNRVRISLVNSYPRDQIVVVSDAALKAGAWTHLTFTYDGSGHAAGLTMFLDGKREKVEVERDHLTESMLPLGIPFALDTFNGLAFGKRWQQSSLVGGAIDELRVFNRALVPVEVAWLHDPESGVDASGLEERYTLSDPAVVTVKHSLTEARAELTKTLTDLGKVMVMGETDHPRPSYVFQRGIYTNHGEEVHPRGLTQIFPYGKDLPQDRRGLATWLFDPNHPLTARVYVNRLWQMHFGQGLVATTEEFGSQGSMPSHPALLDWLAREFVDSHWDIKAINRLIVMSATFRQSSVPTKEMVEKDPTNLLLAHGVSRRMPAELIRDSALQASGLLDGQVGGASVFPYQPEGVWETIDFYARARPYPKAADRPNDHHRRSIYSLIRRNAPVPSMTIFDFPKRANSRVRRPLSNTPLQALVLLNDPQYVEASRALAQRVMAEHPGNLDAQLDDIFKLGARRAAEQAELGILREFYAGELAAFGKAPESADKYLRNGIEVVPAGVDKTTLAALASTANVVLNTPDAYMTR